MLSRYQYYITHQHLIIALIPSETEDLNFFKAIMSQAKEKFTHVILELNSYEVMDQSSIDFVNKIIFFFKMYGVTTYISGILPETAYFLSNLDLKFDAKTYLNIDRIIEHEHLHF